MHYELFNVDYYIIGYYQAEQWLSKHDISVFAGIKFVQDYEKNNPNNPYVKQVSIPRLLKFKKQYPELLKEEY